MLLFVDFQNAYPKTVRHGLDFAKLIPLLTVSNKERIFAIPVFIQRKNAKSKTSFGQLL